jgi:hypothetical protein
LGGASIEKVPVHVHDRFRPGPEAQAVLRECQRRALPAETFPLKRLLRRQLALAPTTLVAGDLDAMPAVFEQMGCTRRCLPSYPDSIRPLLQRRVWESSVGEILAGGGARGFFVKPRDREKRFTGFVYEGPHSNPGLAGASSSTRVYCSEVVDFVTEYRAYVVRGSIRAVAQYAGAPEPASISIAESALELLERAGESVAGFSIDFGRLADGRSALVECNEGFGLGLYPGVDDGAYFELLEARWLELMSHA